MKSSAAEVLVIGRNAAERLTASGLGYHAWLGTNSDSGTTSVQDSRFYHLMGRGSTPDEPLIVMALEPRSLFETFSEQIKTDVAFRILRAALTLFEHHQLPPYWRPFHSGQLLTFQGTGIGRSESSRIALWRSDGPPQTAYAFGITVRQADFNNISPDLYLLKQAQTSWRTHVGADARLLPVAGDGSEIDLGDVAVRGITLGKSLSQIEALLSLDQRRFVASPLTSPIRLRGAAGTGKTLAMVVKALRTVYSSADKNEPVRVLFLTHNGLSADLIRGLLESLDERGVFKAALPEAFMRVDTLVGLAHEQLLMEFENLQPISLDAKEGKELQLLHIDEGLNRVVHETYPLIKKKISPELRESFEALPDSREGRTLRWNMLIEIACILDGEGIRDTPDKRRNYVRRKRRESQWALSSPEDRQLILDIYDAYRESLARNGVMSIDQMIADFMGHLDSFRWAARREKDGFDAVFVDEFHLFNRLEHDVFPGLFRRTAPPLPLVVAFDAKQTPRDTFMGETAGGEGVSTAAGPIAGDAKIGESVRFDLTEVFRYTRAIGAVSNLILGYFPTADLPEDWGSSKPELGKGDGEKPTAFVAEDALSLYRTAFDRAQDAVKQRGGDGRRVAVLSLSHDDFARVSNSQFRDRFIIVDNRETLDRLSQARRRFVFSMPEFVAGLQFDDVIVVDANDRDEREDRSKLAGKRRFVSALYLAVTRARERLTLAARRDGGGLASEIKDGIASGIIRLT